MEMYHTSVDGKDGKINCTLCDKQIEVEEGFYHCSEDKENYHETCANKQKKDKNRYEKLKEECRKFYKIDGAVKTDLVQ